eukprot:4618350-Prorocentrum_lima.AAC.1
MIAGAEPTHMSLARVVAGSSRCRSWCSHCAQIGIRQQGRSSRSCCGARAHARSSGQRRRRA